MPTTPQQLSKAIEHAWWYPFDRIDVTPCRESSGRQTAVVTIHRPGRVETRWAVFADAV